MSAPVDSPSQPLSHSHPSQPGRLLEQFTGLVLGLVILAIGWILVAAAQGGERSATNETVEVTIVLALLSAALGLVSVVALLHTRPRGGE